MSEESKHLHLAVACGGTGGHFYPTMAIAKALQADGHRVTLLVAGLHAAEQLKLASANAIDAVEVPAIRFPGIRNPLALFAFPFRFLACIKAAKREITRLKPDIMLGMGSYAALPACLAKPARIPLVLHEGNAFMGKTNRTLAGRAKAIGLSLPLDDKGQLKGAPSRIVGMPLREALLQAADTPQVSPDFLPSLGLSPERKTVLVFGGSQGARRINELFTLMAPLMAPYKDKIQFMHLTGTDDNAALNQAYQAAGVTASIRKADQNIERCYLASDLVVCRGGASSLCELALFSKTAVIIPLPTAADDHQSVNASLAQRIGGAIHLPQVQATPEILASYMKDLLNDPGRFQDMGQKLHSLARPDAAHNMAKLIEDTFRNCPL